MAASRSFRPPVELAFEEPPRRAVTSINLRREDKFLFDALQAYMAMRAGRPVHQWDVVTAVLAAAFDNPEFEAARAVDRHGAWRRPGAEVRGGR